MPELPNPHDHFFKRMLSQQESAQDFLQHYLPTEVVQCLNLSSLLLVKDSFVDQELQEHFSDLLYEVQLTTGESAYVYVLFEHKSYVDREVSFQLLRYLVRVWEYGLRQKQGFRPIVPLVVYHGQRRWDAAEQFQDLFEIPDALKPYMPAYRYLLSDLSRYSDEEIRGGVLLQVGLLTLKYIFRAELGERVAEFLRLLRELSNQQEALEYLEVLLRYIASAGQQVSETELREAVVRAFSEEGDEAMATIAQQWMEQGRQQGEQQGEQRGLQRGMLEEAREMVLRAVGVRFQVVPPDIAEKVQRITTRATLASLLDLAITSKSLDAFRQQLNQVEN